jgi:signal transduction histidine kinase
VSRIVSGKVRLNVQAVDVPLVLHHSVATILPAADAKGVRVQTIADPRVGPVAGDPDRLQQVLWNLLSNAVKFTPRGGRIQVRLEQVNSHIEIIVSDSGIGIRPEFLPHVFERFRQGEGGSTRSAGGLGWGWRSYDTWWRCTAAPSRPRAPAKVRAPCFVCGCRG